MILLRLGVLALPFELRGVCCEEARHAADIHFIVHNPTTPNPEH